MSNEDTALLWKMLEPDRKFDHIDKNQKDGYCCVKCGHTAKGIFSFYESHCLVPTDPFPGTEADIAERIRLWVSEVECNIHDYTDALEKIWENWQFCEQCPAKFDLWLGCYATPKDKINAALAVWKGME
jgi:hypothetical protein